MGRPMTTGKVVRIAGPIVTVTGLEAKIGDIILLGEWGLLSETIRIRGEQVICQ